MAGNGFGLKWQHHHAIKYNYLSHGTGFIIECWHGLLGFAVRWTFLLLTKRVRIMKNMFSFFFLRDKSKRWKKTKKKQTKSLLLSWCCSLLCIQDQKTGKIDDEEKKILRKFSRQTICLIRVCYLKRLGGIKSLLAFGILNSANKGAHARNTHKKWGKKCFYVISPSKNEH